MESGYYSEMENVDSASPDAADPHGQEGPPRSRGVRGRTGGAGGRRKREFISDEKKDASYWEKRRKNNEAAKRSREKRRISDLVLENQVLALNEENVHLKSELLALKLRFGLITSASYAEQSRQLSAETGGPFCPAYSSAPTLLLQSDSSEAEHSSRGSGFTPISRYSPRGSLSDVSNTSLSAGTSPEPTGQADTRHRQDPADRDVMGDITEAMNVQVVYGLSEPAAFLRGYDEIELVGYKEPAKGNLLARDIIQYGTLQVVDPYPARRRDCTPPLGQGELGVNSTLRPGRSPNANPLAVERQLLAPSPSEAAQRYGGEMVPTTAPGCALPSQRPVPEDPTCGRPAGTERANPRHTQLTAKMAEHIEVQRPDEVPPPHDLSPNVTIGKQEVVRCGLVIEVPPADPAHVDKVSDVTLSEGSDSDCQDRADRQGRVPEAHSDPSQGCKRMALPHKLRLKLRSIQGSEPESGPDHRGHAAPLPRQRGLHRSGCIVKSCDPACGRGDRWSESGPLAAERWQWQGGLPGQFEEDARKGSTTLPRSMDPGHHTVNTAGYKDLEGNTMVN
ncbi:uncharacterized protein LOC144610637 [Rhinoraja longicauda]